MEQDRENRGQRWHLMLMGLLVVSAMLAVLYLFAPPKPPGPIPPTPSPNAFPDLLTAAQLISGKHPDPLRNDPTEIAAYVSANHSALLAIYAALAKPCEAPPDLMNSAKRRSGNGEYYLMREASTLLTQAMWDAEFRGDWNSAMQATHGLLALSRVTSRHGTFLDHLRASTTVSMAFRGLAKWRDELDAHQCRTVIAALLAHEKTRPDFEMIRQWDTYYLQWMIRDWRNFRGTDGFDWKEFLSAHTPGSSFWKNQDAHAENLRRHYHQRIAEAGLLRLELTLRLYLLERGALPGRLGELVPDFLPQLPEDPFSRTGFVYRTNGTNWLLYSIGPDRVDNGGRPLLPGGYGTIPTGDICFTNRAPMPVAP